MRSTMQWLRGAVLAGALTLTLASSAPAQMTPAQLAAARAGTPQFQVNPLLFNAARLNLARNVALGNQATALAQLAPLAVGSNPYVAPINYGALVPAYNPFAGVGASAYVAPSSLSGVGATLTSNPYATSPGVGGTLASNGYGGGMNYNPYGYGSYYYDPYGGYFRGVGDLINSYGKYYNQYQDARMKSVQVEQAKIDLRKALFDEWRYYRSQMPTYEDLRQASIKRDHTYSLRPNSTDILNASSLNTLLEHLKQIQAKGLTGPPLDLDPDTLKRINVRTDRGGNIGLLKNGGKLSWPLSLRLPLFDELRKGLELHVEQAVERANVDGKPIDAALLRDLKSEVAALNDTLDKNINKITLTAYNDAKRYLNLLQDAVRALEDPNVADYFHGKYSAQGKTVAKLVDYMTKNGLRFAPATPGDEGAYRALQSYMAAYDDGLTRLASRTP